MSTFTAQNMGAGKIDRVKEGYRMCYVIVLTAGAVLCVMYQRQEARSCPCSLTAAAVRRIRWDSVM